MGETPVGNDYVGQTVLNPLGLAAILILGMAMLFVPRRYAVWTMIVMGCLVSPAQRIVFLTLNFDLLRIMVLFATARILVRGEWDKFAWSSMDTVLLAFAVIGSSVYILQSGKLDTAKGELGSMYDILGLYFVSRCLVRDLNDVSRVALGFAIISLPVALAFLVERATGRNIFASFGGVPEVTAIRNGKLRCQGAYAHPIIAGCYWATVLPLIAALWWRRKSDRLWAVIGVSCGLIIILLCNSSTPVSAVACGAIGAAFFAIRRFMRMVRWAMVAILVALHLTMKAPVWNLVSRIDLVGGSGYHRFNLIDQFVNHFGQWWLLGARDVQQWGIFAGDLTNQFCLEAARGGLATLLLFVALIVMAFSRIGRLWRREQGVKTNLVMSWALGVSLAVHCVSFIGVSYFGQIVMVWYLTLAMIASLGTKREVSQAKRGGTRASSKTRRRPIQSTMPRYTEMREPQAQPRPLKS